MRNVLFFTLALAVATAGTVLATGTEHEVGGGPEKGHTVPFYAPASAMRFQCMWFQFEIAEKGSVARIEFLFDSGGAAPTVLEGCKMFLCHSSKEKLTNTFKKN